MIKRETDLYSPVKTFLEEQGYTVRSEVRNCDLAAVREDQLLIAELKTSFNLDLVLQGVERKRLCDEVYLAVPRPGNAAAPRWRKILRLCRALGLGLLTVSARGLVEIVCCPSAQPPRRMAREQKYLLREFTARSGDYNTGGSRGKPLVTAYREHALQVAVCIDSGCRRPRDVAAVTGLVSAPSILQKNFYGWFEREERGIYRLSALGYQALQDYAEVVKLFK